MISTTDPHGRNGDGGLYQKRPDVSRVRATEPLASVIRAIACEQPFDGRPETREPLQNDVEAACRRREEQLQGVAAGAWIHVEHHWQRGMPSDAMRDDES